MASLLEDAEAVDDADQPQVRRENKTACPHFLYQKRDHFYQDRLGTSTGRKTQRQAMFSQELAG